VSRRFLVFVLILVSIGAGVVAQALRRRAEALAAFDREVRRSREVAAEMRARIVLPQKRKIAAGANFATALERMGLTWSESAGAIAAAQRAFNLRQVRAGNVLTIGRSVEGELRSIEYQIDAERKLEITPAETGFRAEVRDIPATTETVSVTGRVRDSLFNAVEDAGESPELALRLAQIFGYDLDFYTDTREGDTFTVVLEKKKYASGLAAVAGETAAYGRIFAAEYLNAGHPYQALLFHDSSGRAAYYAPDGKSLQKMFLRSPLKFGGHVTSHFSRARFHPILKRYRPHMGIDYGAPIGTPVQTIGSGRVLFAGRKGGEGNMVHVAHSGGYETMYLHLSRIFVRPGQRVEIGKTIGLVGSTGLSTGPHLDFRILQRGQYKNFERLGLPPADPVPQRLRPEFETVRAKWLPLLKNPALLQAQAEGQPQGGAGGSPHEPASAPSTAP
jgi:murein DD-endopeptidase MepM/ murein hydrolase activator NlpD